MLTGRGFTICAGLAPALVMSLALAWGPAGCGSQQHEPGQTQASTAPAPAAPEEPAVSEAPAEPAEPAEPAVSEAPEEELRDVVVVTDRAALDELVEHGAGLGALLHGEPAASNRELARQPRYGSIARVIGRDLDAIDREDPKAGVGIRGHVHRLFDRGWLASPRARYELVGLVHRIDFAPIHEDMCGEIHLLYRLAYTTEVSGEQVSSRLPMTLVVVLPGAARKEGDMHSACGHAARAWRAPADVTGAALGKWLAQGPLGELGPERVHSVRVNLQSVRWPSSVRPDLGGHAEYIMRVFAPAPGAEAGGPMRPTWLENTPDSRRLRKNTRLRAELVAWIGQNLDAIEEGTARVPSAYLTRVAVSVTPRGMSRRANRPYRQIFTADDFAEMELAGRPLIGSPEALLRRLDDLTCAGCHQSRTIAGFHLLGEDGDDVAPGNALAVSVSAHMVDEIARRAAITRALATGAPVDFVRPFAERGPGDPGTLGARCGLASGEGDVDPGFRAWTCAEGLACMPYDVPGDDAVVGMCLPTGSMEVGGPCEFGPIRPHRNPHRDRARRDQSAVCGGAAVCNVNRTGFPGGMCTASCESLPSSGTCGVIALLQPFNNCLARRTPFPRCLAEHVAPAGLRACDIDRPCRDDYICARTPSGEGACIPPYFLFQMRVDGHPH